MGPCCPTASCWLALNSVNLGQNSHLGYVKYVEFCVNNTLRKCFQCIKALNKQGTTACCNLSTQDLEVGGPGFQDKAPGIVSSKPAWATSEPVSKTHSKTHTNKLSKESLASGGQEGTLISKPENWVMWGVTRQPVCRGLGSKKAEEKGLFCFVLFLQPQLSGLCRRDGWCWQDEAGRSLSEIFLKTSLSADSNNSNQTKSN